MKTESLSDTSPTGICANTLLSVYTGNAGVTPTTDSNGKIVSGAFDEAQREVVTKSVLDWSTDPAVELTGTVPFQTVQANWTQVIWQQAQLSPSAGNELQNSSCTWNEVFIGETEVES